VRITPSTPDVSLLAHGSMRAACTQYPYPSSLYPKALPLKSAGLPLDSVATQDQPLRTELHRTELHTSTCWPTRRLQCAD